ncbi:hypothetical protein MBH78_19525 [Oceanimonas sp. NS1]|nr:MULTISPECIES: hypothetical protein [Oceanimonas]MCT7656219.1 hypothetical protein [Oceanimonas sp. NS1]NHI00839.1 hypothetical protein [Oceanimonas sp. MB9]
MKTGILLMVLWLSGCGGTPSSYHSEREIPEGPGLLTGEDGAYLYQR